MTDVALEVAMQINGKLVDSGGLHAVASLVLFEDGGKRLDCARA